MEFIPSSDFKVQDGQWDGFTLILPCVSVANVPQLTVDLLINETVQNQERPIANRDLELVGSLWSENVYPYAGVDPFFMGGHNHATSIQVFVSVSKKLVIIQQRSPVYKESRAEFYKELGQWIGRHRFDSVLILSSSFDQFLLPEHHEASEVPIKYMASNLNDSLREYIKNTSRIQPVVPVDPETMVPTLSGKIHLPGSGSTRGYLKSFTQDLPQTPVLVLVLFCSEGENRHHAMVFADIVAEILNRSNSVFPVQKSQKQEQEFTLSKYFWNTPWSWRRMYGDEPPAELF